MTAVASPSVQSAPLGWYNSSGDGGQGPVNSDEVSRMFTPRKSLQRSNSSSSLASSSSSTTTVNSSAYNIDALQNINNINVESQGTVSSSSSSSSSKKKSNRSVWPSAKSEPVSGVTNARSQVTPVLPQGPTASSTMSAIRQPSHVLPSQHILQTPFQNHARQVNGSSGSPHAILTLLPLNGTFEKKQISVPYFPDVLRIGRQTNAKTIPTSMNGYFDSKVLSRQHAEVYADKSGKIWIRDVKSSNGTFVNSHRLSPDSRESDPHELHENDVLELGIDIVSEDQKTIVHQKVAAKIEHAGVYGSGMNIFDLNFGDLDPASSNGALSSPLSQSMSSFNGRPGSAASNRSMQSAASNQVNALQQQRQANYWSSPISVEQVVKRLTVCSVFFFFFNCLLIPYQSEMRQAKQQSQDLRQTDDFLKAASKPDGERRKHSILDGSSLHRQANGRSKITRVDSLSRFSDPPAPPPQQPLPEKPDAMPRTGADAFSVLKRSDTEKPKSPGSAGPSVPRDSSQILSLIEALTTARREIDTQGTRVKELEGLLSQERSAREWAEVRVKQAEGLNNGSQQQAPVVTNGSLSSLEAKKAGVNGISTPAEGISEPGSDGAAATDKVGGSVDLTTKNLERQLQNLKEEMEEMRRQVDTFKQRAQKEETEKLEARKSLTEMIDTLRRERASANSLSLGKTITSSHDLVASHNISNLNPESGIWKSEDGTLQCLNPNRLPQTKNMGQGGAALTGRHNLLESSSPYASMIGVVLLGVGLMAYLNGWQKIEK